MLPAQIFLTLYRYPSLLSIASGRFSRLYSVSAQSLSYIGSGWSSCLCLSMWMGPPEYVAYEFATISSSVSRMSSSIIFLMGSRWPYSCCFVGCCFQDLFSIARSILVWLPSSFFSLRLVSVHVVHPCSSVVTTAAWKNLRFIILVRFDFHLTNSLSIAVNVLARHSLMSFSDDESLHPR